MEHFSSGFFLFWIENRKCFHFFHWNGWFFEWDYCWWIHVIYDLLKTSFITSNEKRNPNISWFFNIFIDFFTGFWVRSSVTSAIYRKSLRVSPQGKAESTTGEVVNLMSVDTQRIVDMMPYINMLWRFVGYFSPRFFPRFII